MAGVALVVLTMQGGPASAFGTCAASGTTAQNPYRWTMRTSPKPRAYSKSEWCERNVIKNKRCAAVPSMAGFSKKRPCSTSGSCGRSDIKNERGTFKLLKS